MRKPDFNNLLNVLRREAPDRPTLFEFFLNARLYARFAGPAPGPDGKPREGLPLLIKAFGAAGYDYATTLGCDMWFRTKDVPKLASRSMDALAVISDRATFESYAWPDPDACDYSRLETCAPLLPEGMKFVVNGPNGVLENAMGICGYQGLCYIIADDPQLAQDIFDAVGSRLLRYYEICAKYDSAGALISNDDWGFNTQTMLSPELMRRYVFPWHKRIVQAIHAAGKPAILHACGQLESVMDDIIDDMKYDGKHSYEDKILPVEEAYERWSGRIAILGGIDVDFVCRSTPEQVRARSLAMLKRAETRGAYALGTGNSVPEWVPDENYLAMISAALD